MKQHGPWKILNRKIMYKSPWLEVNEDSVIRPDGKPGIFSTVKKSDGVSILPIDNEGNVVISVEDLKKGLIGPDGRKFRALGNFLKSAATKTAGLVTSLYKGV